MNAPKPEVGQWYRHLDKGESFLVVGIDDEARTIEVQSFDGDLDEIDQDSWQVMTLARTEPPEDWTGPMDDIERDDLGYADAEEAPPNLTQPPKPLDIEAWDDTGNEPIDFEEVDEPEPASAASVAAKGGSQNLPR